MDVRVGSTKQQIKANQSQFDQLQDYWATPIPQLTRELGASQDGLTTEDANARREHYGPNILIAKKTTSVFKSFLLQFRNPIIDLLLFAAIISLALDDLVDGFFILIIVFVSNGLDLFQEFRANTAVEKLLSLIQTTVQVMRDGEYSDIPAEDVVPGDVVIFSAGKNVPGDCILLESKDLFLNEAPLTGEAFPVEKMPGTSSSDAGIANRSNLLFMGTSVVSGSGKALVVKTGMATEFGKISYRLQSQPPKTEFEKVTARYGYFLMQITLILTVSVFLIEIILHGGTISLFQSFLFALALAISMTPEMLPAIITITLASGAKKMARKKVIVKRLNSIENFGSLNILCSDKTGTLTEGVMHLESITDYAGNPSNKVDTYAYLNAFFQSGYVNPIDQAICTMHVDSSMYTKLDELPYDFIRKRLSILVKTDEKNILICKGDIRKMLEICTTAEANDGQIVDLEDVRKVINDRFKQWGKRGYKVLGLASKELLEVPPNLEQSAEDSLTFLGFIIFHDPLREDIQSLIQTLDKLQIQLKIITGDNRVVAHSVAEQVHLHHPKMLFGPDIKILNDEELARIASKIDLFAEIEPNQKERIVVALRKSGNVVGFIGDGINDASALHAADVGISVQNAVDVAKEAADLILLDKHLDVVIDGIIEGRKTYENTTKYIFITTSTNFAITFTLTGAAFFLPILPMVPEQLLLTNILTDIPFMSIATDNVDEERVAKPHKWDTHFIRQFMLVFGSIGSIFDFITFAVLYSLIGYNQDLFSTGWFLESTLQEFFVIFIIRTQRSFFKSKPNKSVVFSFLALATICIMFPYLPVVNGWLHFVPPKADLFFVICVIVVAYLFTIEIVKRFFYRRIGLPDKNSIKKYSITDGPEDPPFANLFEGIKKI